MRWNEQIRGKLSRLPDEPGVYIMRDRRGEVIYIGKASSLRRRVRHYFQQGTLKSAEPKLRGLLRSVDDIDFITVRTEPEAALTEARLIKDYKPRYNVLLRDDKRFLLIKVNMNDPYPRFETCRLKKNDGATYYGPYRSSAAARAALEFLDKRLGLRRCRPREPGKSDYEHCMNDIIRYCSAPCIGRISRAEYRALAEEACAFLRGERREYFKEIRRMMEAEAAEQRFEKAAALRDLLGLLHDAVRQRTRLAKTPRMKKEEALNGLQAIGEALGLPAAPRRVECYDISNISGTFSVASMVAAIDGLPEPRRYRHFRIREVSGIDDPRCMEEVIRRRFDRALKEAQALPDLIIVDGGITQLRAARRALDVLGLERLPAAGLAKRMEELIAEDGGRVRSVVFERGSPPLHVLQQIRDEAHRFALTYHRKLRSERIRESALDDISGIGPRKKNVLLKHFGSMRRLRNASAEDIARAPGIGPATARMIFDHLHGQT